jgi:alkylation response protein AidB-like acyl-CoA dehydrogenase
LRPAPRTGGGFLLHADRPEAILCPEDVPLSEQNLVEEANRFMDEEVLPQMAALERQEEGLARKLFTRAGRLGLLGIEMPVEFGGLGLGKRAAIAVGERLARGGGFGLTCSVHSGVGSAGVCYFGTREQKQEYIPRLARGEWMAAYCLSEASSGSDALGMRTTAVRSGDGENFVLNGEKKWITNSGWADLFTVFAKVDGHVTAFLVERAFPGVSTGAEENKLGLKSSSTRRVIFQDVSVPIRNVLGEVGKGAYIAFNVLNFGRLNFGVTGIGLAEEQLRVAIAYARHRQQFGKPIATFGLVKKKLAEMAVKVFAAQSSAFRTAGLIDEMMATGELMDSIAPNFPRALEEFALECSVVKVRGAEAASEVADESLQIHGGCGFTEDFSPAQALRDARLNRIGEGTNEINRVFIPTLLKRRFERGRFPLQDAIARASDETVGNGGPPAGGLEAAAAFLANAKRLVFLLCATANSRFWDKNDEDQEVLAAIADVIADIYLGESALLRALKTPLGPGGGIQSDLVMLFIDDAAPRVMKAARLVLEASCDPTEFPGRLERVRALLAWDPINPLAMRIRVAGRLCEQGGYPRG